jgi:DNA ligase-1
MMTIPEGFKPQLAIEQTKVKTQPANRYMSEKLDGIRCIVFGGVAYSRSLKPIPNKFIQAYFKNQWTGGLLDGLDGELIVGDKNAPDVFNQSTSGVMRIEGEPDFTFWVFDRWHPTATWLERYARLVNLDRDDRLPLRVEVLQHYSISCDEQLDEFEAEMLAQGAEGVMIRDTDAKYKCGRSGTKTPELQKVKRFVDNEFQIIGWEPKYTNTNEAKTNELGRTERSTAKEGMVALDTMGSLILCTSKGDTFSCGSGMTDAIRADLWERRETLMGQLAKVKYFDVGTGYNVPRFPVLVGIRHKDDL